MTLRNSMVTSNLPRAFFCSFIFLASSYIYFLSLFSLVQLLDTNNFLANVMNETDVLGIITEINEPQWTTFTNQSNPTLRRDIRIKDET